MNDKLEGFAREMVTYFAEVSCETAVVGACLRTETWNHLPSKYFITIIGCTKILTAQVM